MTQPASLGDAVLVLKTDDGPLNKGLDDAHSKTASWAKAGTVAIAGMGVAAVAMGVVSVNAAATFEHAIDQVGAVANATDEEIGQLSDTALRIGKDTAFGATEAAQAMEALAANGLSVTDIINGAADATVALAAAGGTDLVTAADLASTSMTVWGIAAEDMTDVVNRLAGAANVSKFSVEDMAGAVAQGGGVAAVSGVEFEDFAASIAAVAPSFSGGADAGTSFKTFLQRLTLDTNTAQDAMAALGHDVGDLGNPFFTATGEMKSMAEITQFLHDKTANLSEEQKLSALSTIFGSDALRVAAGLAEMTAVEFQALSDTMGDTSAADVAAARMGNFKGSMDSLMGSIETVQIEVGMKLIPVLSSLADLAASYIPIAFDATEQAVADVIAALQRFEPQIEVVRTAIERTVAMFQENEQAAGALAFAVGTVLVAAFVALAVAAGAAAVSMIIAVGPVLLVIAAVAALAAGVYLLIENWDAIVEKWPAVGEAFAQVQAKGEELADWFVVTMMPAIADLVEAIRVAGVAIIQFVTDHWAEISRILEGAWIIIYGIVEFAINAIKTAIESWVLIVTGIIQVFTGVLTGDWEQAWEGIKKITDGVLTFITGMFSAFVDLSKAILEGGFIIIWNLLELGWDVFLGHVREVLGHILSALAALPGQAVTALQALPGLLWNLAQDAFGAVHGLWAGIVAKWLDLKVWLGELPGKILSALGDLGGLLFQAGKDLIQGFIDGIGSMFGALGDAIEKLPGGGIVTGAIGAGAGLFKAEGGPVAAGQPYFVGEKGIEMFVPSTAGTIISNDSIAAALGGGGSPTFVFNIEGDADAAKIQAALSEWVAFQAGPGAAQYGVVMPELAV